MRYAIVSDIHANRQAWTVVQNDIRSLETDRTLCLGDIVGYGPAPAEVFADVYANVHNFTLGNHDAVICSKMDPAAFNDDARAIIDWTAQHLDAKAAEFLSRIPLVLQGADFRCAHGEMASPDRFRYVLEPEDARLSLDACSEQLLFVGHTHVARIFVIGRSGQVHALPPQDFELEEGKRYVVNVGSVGQPRDGDPRASYCLYDRERRSVFFRRVPFDVEAYRGELERARIPAGPSYFLRVAESQRAEPIRDLLVFRPAGDDEYVQSEYTVEALEEAVRSARRWRVLALSVFVLALGTVAAGFAWLRYHLPKEVTYEATATGLIGQDLDPGAELLLTNAAIGKVAPENPLAHWTVTLTDPALQSLEGVEEEDNTVLRLRSQQALPFQLRSRTVAAKPPVRLSAKVQFRAEQLQSAVVEIALVEVLADGGERVLVQREFGDRFSEDKWQRTSITMPKEHIADLTGEVRVVLRGQCVGTVLFRDCKVVRAE